MKNLNKTLLAAMVGIVFSGNASAINVGDSHHIVGYASDLANYHNDYYPYIQILQGLNVTLTKTNTSNTKYRVYLRGAGQNGTYPNQVDLNTATYLGVIDNSNPSMTFNESDIPSATYGKVGVVFYIPEKSSITQGPVSDTFSATAVVSNVDEYTKENLKSYTLYYSNKVEINKYASRNVKPTSENISKNIVMETNTGNNSDYPYYLQFIPNNLETYSPGLFVNSNSPELFYAFNRVVEGQQVGANQCTFTYPSIAGFTAQGSNNALMRFGGYAPNIANDITELTFNLYCPSNPNTNPWDSKDGWIIKAGDAPIATYKHLYSKHGAASKLVTPIFDKTTIGLFVDAATLSFSTSADQTKSLCKSALSTDPNFIGADGDCKVLVEETDGLIFAPAPDLNGNLTKLKVAANKTVGSKAVKTRLLYKHKGGWYDQGSLNPLTVNVIDVAPPSIDDSAPLEVHKGKRLTANDLVLKGEFGTNMKASFKNASGETLVEGGTDTVDVLTDATGKKGVKVSTLTDMQSISADNRTVGEVIPVTVDLRYAYDTEGVKAATKTVNVKVMPVSNVVVAKGQENPKVFTDESYTFNYRLQLEEVPTLAFSEQSFGAGWTGTVKIKENGTTGQFMTSDNAVGTYSNGQISVAIDGSKFPYGKKFDLLIEFTNPSLNNKVVSLVQSFDTVKNEALPGTFTLSNTSLVAEMPIHATLVLNDMTEIGLTSLDKINFKYRKKGSPTWINAKDSELKDAGFKFSPLMNNAGTWEFAVSTLSKAGKVWESEVKTVDVSSSPSLSIKMKDSSINLFKHEKAVIEFLPDARETRSLSNAVILAKADANGQWMKLSTEAGKVDEFLTALSIMPTFAATNLSAEYTDGRLEVLNANSELDKNNMLGLSVVAIDKSVFEYWSEEVAGGRKTPEEAAGILSSLINKAKTANTRVTWNVAKAPRIRVAGLDPTTESGVTQNLLITATNALSGYDGEFTNIKGIFVGNDGQKIPFELVNGAAQVAWTPNIDSMDPVMTPASGSEIHSWYENASGDKVKNPVQNKLASWEDNFVNVYRMNMFKYTFPEYVLDVKTDYTVAPSSFNVRLSTVQPVSSHQLRKFPISYEWSVVNNDTSAVDSVTFKAQKERFTGQFLKAGTYTITLNYIDGKGNTGTASKVITLAEPANIQITFKDTYSNKFMRAPLSGNFNLLLSAEHKKERVTSAKWYLNGELIKDINKGALTRHQFTNMPAGDQVIRVELTSNFGKTSVAEKTVTVLPNKVPVCNKIEVQDYTTYTKYSANCSDTDGKVSRYRWTINGEVVAPVANRITTFKSNGTVNSITVEAQDDAGEWSEPVN